ncbi:MAG: type II toxin-antitoxin system VapC family toxin [Thermoplasmatales archaeon]|nr:type II toxin-antitoxin system VapC family toxin [Thermoplasmatales archaeon]MDA8142440.1 type II toxin-antitoxin system VapC family toxin [Thermoplasmatales archaeon]
MVVLDTNVIIDYLLGKSDVVQIIETFPSNELCMTFVNEFELLKHKNRKELEEPIENLAIYQSSEAAVREAANAYIRLISTGKVMSDNDLMIYGVCVANNEILLTQDKAFENLHSEFVRVLK